MLSLQQIILQICDIVSNVNGELKVCVPAVAAVKKLVVYLLQCKLEEMADILKMGFYVYEKIYNRGQQ